MYQVTSRDKYPDLHIDSFHNLDIVGTEGVELVSDIDTKLQAGKDLHIGVLVSSISAYFITGACNCIWILAFKQEFMTV